jgi:hypothetical protein
MRVRHRKEAFNGKKPEPQATEAVMQSDVMPSALASRCDQSVLAVAAKSKAWRWFASLGAMQRARTCSIMDPNCIKLVVEMASAHHASDGKGLLLVFMFTYARK